MAEVIEVSVSASGLDVVVQVVLVPVDEGDIETTARLVVGFVVPVATSGMRALLGLLRIDLRRMTLFAGALPVDSVAILVVL